MALSGPEKELRGQSSLEYHTLIRGSSEREALDHHQAKASSDLDRLNVAGTLTVSPISVGSKVKATRYRQCLKNHAASMGGNVTDGCGEFMPSGEEGTIEALKCAACSCHRSFHRKEVEGGGGGGDSALVHALQLPPPLPSPSVNQHHRTLPLGHVPSLANHYASMVPPVKMAFGGSGGGSAGTESSSEELNFNAYHSNSGQAPPPPPHPLVLSKKRFRTKFTQEQKERMLEFAEKVGWRIPREDDPEVQRFCAEVGVKRQVLKVWMHNNKNSSARKLQPEGQDQQIIEDCTS